MSNALTIDRLHVSYHGQDALENVSLSIQEGTMTGIIGPNGAGKSTLLKACLDLIEKDQGDIRFFEQPFKQVRKQIAYVPQRNDLDWTFPIHVLDTVLLGTYPKLGLIKRPKKEDRAYAYHCLEKVGMKDFAKRQIGELSGGQQQRVFLARALAQNAQLFCLDEPFVGIDMASEETMVRILKELRDEGKTILVVHHDLSKADDYFSHLVLLNKKLIKAGPVHDILRPEIMLEAYETQLPFLKSAGGDV
ncbi:manganese transporter [Bacillus safensis]|uniref:Fe(3+) dicitrate transport ATP-binding protein FecE n=2 Tax=Bacteria TaxID=2 RepID=A0A5C0WID5_BACIA|nr:MULTISPECIES: metal ABC transporter ATP-binding protein [Bacillus]KRE19108.1 manganese transporter [Bacillus sp. Root920]MBG9820575.1 manganese transporter [Bacillus safensis]MBG9823678.1 manganese transporter [Bacillus safensis]MBG9833429.1 manganese transporter [Bacillus safensis]MBG9862385.1 manganese transporter [Bacillus safensis]